MTHTYQIFVSEIDWRRVREHEQRSVLGCFNLPNEIMVATAAWWQKYIICISQDV